MAFKQFEVDDLGLVSVYKRRGSRSIRLSVTSDGLTRVTMPTWLPYQAGLAFVQQKKTWLLSQQKVDLFTDGQRVGKYHTLKLIQRAGLDKPRTQLSETTATVYHSAHASQAQIQIAAHAVTKRAAKVEAEKLLPQRLRELARKFGFTYNQVSVRHLKSRWGSCSSQKNITLNYYLMQLPWELIDYVLLHELSHTKELNHSAAFWDQVEACVPDYKVRRQKLKQFQPSLLATKA